VLSHLAHYQHDVSSYFFSGNTNHDYQINHANREAENAAREQTFYKNKVEGLEDTTVSWMPVAAPQPIAPVPGIPAFAPPDANQLHNEKFGKMTERIRDHLTTMLDADSAQALALTCRRTQQVVCFNNICSYGNSKCDPNRCPSCRPFKGMRSWHMRGQEMHEILRMIYPLYAPPFRLSLRRPTSKTIDSFCFYSLRTTNLLVLFLQTKKNQETKKQPETTNLLLEMTKSTRENLKEDLERQQQQQAIRRASIVHAAEKEDQEIAYAIQISLKEAMATKEQDLNHP